MYDYLVYIGRFQPFHNGHKTVIDAALKQAKKVIVLIGSDKQPRSLRNPFTFAERSETIYGSVPMDDHHRVITEPLEDYPYNDSAWIAAVQKAVKGVTWNYSTGNLKIGLIGHSKDNSSYYLKLFPQWGSVNVEQKHLYSATDVRNAFFTTTPHIHSAILPRSTQTFLTNFLDKKEFNELVREQEYITKYKKSWENSPYPPTFVTADAVVTQAGHVLVIERKASPGKGLLAMPGGFLDQSETLEECAVRELHEETRLKVSKEDLLKSITKVRTFDGPNRSERGRIITTAFRFTLTEARELPKIKGGSDAGKAFWMPISQLKSEDFFEDHYAIIKTMLELN